MRGRHPSGPEFVNKLDGSPAAKERLRVLLETLTGTCRVGDACVRLGIKEARFDQIRVEALQAALHALEIKPAGRKPRPVAADEGEARQLRERIAWLEAELIAASAQLELAGTLPQVGQKKTTATSPPHRRRVRKKRS